MQDSIIVYRNPVEKAFWEGAMNGGFFNIFVFIIAFFIGFGLMFAFIKYVIRVNRTYNQAPWPEVVSIAAGFISAGYAIIYLG